MATPAQPVVRNPASLLGKTLAVVGMVPLVLPALIMLITRSITQQRAEKQATLRLDALIDATGVMASASAFAHDATLATETAQAVSYTHLDVYKRQQRFSTKRAASCGR